MTVIARILTTVLYLILLTGCASHTLQLPIFTNKPANPNAPESAFSPRPNWLQAEVTDTAEQPPITKPTSYWGWYKTIRCYWEAVPFIKRSLKSILFKVRLCCEPQVCDNRLDTAWYQRFSGAETCQGQRNSSYKIIPKREQGVTRARGQIFIVDKYVIGKDLTPPCAIFQM